MTPLANSGGLPYTVRMVTPRKTAFFVIWAILALLPAALPASAHPHVYVDASLTFVVDDKGLASMREHWLFDEIFSNAIMADLGLTAETLASPMGQKKIQEGAFAYLGKSGYFTFVETNGKRIPIRRTTNFKAAYSEGRLSYDFTVPLIIPFDKVKNFRAAVFDKEYYSDILLLKDQIAFEIDGMAQVSHVVRPAKDQTYWQFIVPEAVHITITPPGQTAEEMPAEVMQEVEAPGPMERIMTLVRDVQKELTLKLNGFGMDIRGNPLGSALWMFLGFSFLYGVVHAVGPGHGKTVVCTYFLSNPGSFLAGAVMGNTITFVHMGSAAVAVSVAYLIFSTGMGGFAEASRNLQPASYALLALMGVGLTIKAIVDLVRKKDAIQTCEHGEVEEGANMKRVLMVSFVTGLIPCPGAAVILAFAIGQNILWAGILALIVMAIGMGLTTTLFAWGAVMARTATFKATSINATLARYVRAGLSICGAATIALFGAVLFMSSTGWH